MSYVSGPALHPVPTPVVLGWREDNQNPSCLRALGITILLPDDIYMTVPRGLGDLSEIPATDPYNQTVLLQMTSGSLGPPN